MVTANLIYGIYKCCGCSLKLFQGYSGGGMMEDQLFFIRTGWYRPAVPSCVQFVCVKLLSIAVQSKRYHIMPIYYDVVLSGGAPIIIIIKCPVHLSHKCPIPISLYVLTSHIMCEILNIDAPVVLVLPHSTHNIITGL